MEKYFIILFIASSIVSLVGYVFYIISIAKVSKIDTSVTDFNEFNKYGVRKSDNKDLPFNNAYKNMLKKFFKILGIFILISVILTLIISVCYSTSKSNKLIYSEIHSLNQEVDSLKNEISDVEDRLLFYDEEIERLENEKNSENAYKSWLQLHITNMLDDDIKKCEDNIKFYKSLDAYVEKDRYRENIATYTKRIEKDENFKKKVSSYDNLKDLEKCLSEDGWSITELSNEFKIEYKNQIDDLNNEKSSLNEELSSYENELNSKTTQIDNLNNNINKITFKYCRAFFDTESISLVIYCAIALVSTIIMLLLFPIYMYPTKVARKTEHDQTTAITWLNFFFAETLIMWIILLIWANSGKKQVPQVVVKEDSLTDKLQEIQKLKEQGLLTEEEFETKKKQILNM